MERRKFMQSAAAGAAGLAIPAGLPADQLPAYMPILEDKMAEGWDPCYLEREITEPTLVCDSRGKLNPDAVGWARTPLFTANLTGHWPRKKKWNFWNWISDKFVFSVTIAHIDYLYFSAVSMTDFETGEEWSTMALKPPVPSGRVMPERVEESVEFAGGGVEAALIHHGDHIKVDVACRASGKRLEADFRIMKPGGHETLNIVVPWTMDRFQMNSKHNTLPVEGAVKLGDKTFEMDPRNCHGVQDFGRGMWPYRSLWNWGVATGVADGVAVGVNIGSKWTTGTGANENGICVEGRLYKVMEDLVWEYDNRKPMAQWRVYSKCSDMIDITLSPIHLGGQKISIGLVRTGGICPFGRWNGTVRPDGREIRIQNMMGWAEEFEHRW